MKGNIKNYNIKKTFKCTVFLLKMIWGKKHGSKYMVIKGLTSVLDSFFPILFTVLPGLIINELIYGQKITTIAIYLIILLLCPLINLILHIIVNRCTTKWSFYIRNELETDFYVHLSKVDFEYRESPEIEMMGGRAKDTIQDSLNIVSQIFGLFSAILSVIGLSVIISNLTPLIIITIIIIMYFNSIISKRLNAKLYNLNLESDRISRFILVAHNPLAQYIYAKEMRLNNLTSFMNEKKRAVENDNFNIEKSKVKSKDEASVLQTILSVIQQSILYVYLIYEVIYRNLPIGNMSIYLNAGGQFAASINRVFNAYILLSNNVPHVDELVEYFKLPIKHDRSGKKIPVFDSSSTIQFKNVSFKYPGSDNYVLHNLNLTIKGSEKLCIVGENGAGKTTFIKLLCRFFSPIEGEILLNGVNIEEYDIEKYHRMFATVFQNYQVFDGLTLGENIVLADVFDRDRLDAVCFNAGISKLIEKLPSKYDTYINKWVDEHGIIPSGGEEQRIAIARACYHGGDIYLLDEPTAALDPLAEYDIYTQFHNMIKNKCAILITHRLSAVQLANKIAVFENGQVVEYGTHSELYAKGGIYTEMFDKQAQFYRNANKSDEGNES